MNYRYNNFGLHDHKKQDITGKTLIQANGAS